MVNFVTMTMTSTSPARLAPNPLIARERIIRCRSAGSRSVRNARFQCRTIPVCPSVNDVNTPMMYSWISRVTSAW